jgi:hypothetical protein
VKNDLTSEFSISRGKANVFRRLASKINQFEKTERGGINSVELHIKAQYTLFHATSEF